MEDAMILNKSSVERGMFHGQIYQVCLSCAWPYGKCWSVVFITLTIILLNFFILSCFLNSYPSSLQMLPSLTLQLRNLIVKLSSLDWESYIVFFLKVWCNSIFLTDISFPKNQKNIAGRGGGGCETKNCEVKNFKLEPKCDPSSAPIIVCETTR